MSTHAAPVAAASIQLAWRDYRLARTAARVRAMQEQSELRRRERADAAVAKLKLASQRKQFYGAMARVWPVVREVLLCMIASAILVVISPPEARSVLPPPFAVRESDPPLEQARAAVAGAAVAVAAFTAFFMTLTLLYVFRWERLLYTIHSMWIFSLLSLPFAALLWRVHTAFGIPLDAITLTVVACNISLPAVILVHWTATEARFAKARQLHADVMAIVLAWALARVPWQTAVTALLMLAVLDIFLVSLPGAPVQKLDEIARQRKYFGEPQMPGLTYKNNGDLELGFGDFVVYSAFAAQAACVGLAPFAAVLAAVAVGLIVTMGRIALASRRTVLPALPLAVAMASALLALERLSMQPLSNALVDAQVWL